MSRQSKLRNKRTARAWATREHIEAEHGKMKLGPRKRGPRVPWGMPK
jgi:hypothetical protein